MNQISPVQINSVDPTNYYNPRTLGVTENVERLKSSIDRFGYLEEFPITVCRSPEPNTDGYDYRYVSGQCRLRACQELGMEKIPAIILDLNDDEARQRAWIENELRSDLLLGDKARFTEKVYYEHSGDGRTPDEALELAADYLGVTSQTVRQYFRLSGLPDDVLALVNQKLLTSKEAQDIVTNTLDTSQREESAKRMTERANWLMQSPDPESRKFAGQAIRELKHKATMKQLSDFVKDKVREAGREVRVIIPEAAQDALMKWGEERGLQDKTVIVQHLIADTLRRGNE